MFSCPLLGFNSWVWVNNFPWVYVHANESWVYFYPDCDYYSYKGRDWDIPSSYKSWELQSSDFWENAGWIWTGDWPVSPYVYSNKEKKWGYLNPKTERGLYFYSVLDNSWMDLTFGGLLSLSPVKSREDQLNFYIENIPTYGSSSFLQDVNQSSSQIDLSTYGLEGSVNLEPLILNENLQYLNLANSPDVKIVSLAPIGHLENLDTLTLGSNLLNNKIYDQIHSESLRTLWMHADTIKDASFLKNLPNLSDLAISGSEIKDVSEIANLKNLEFLEVTNTSVSHFPDFTNLQKLIAVNLNDNLIHDLAFLEKIYSVEELNLRNNNITDLTSLSSLNKLENLYLDGNEISNIAALEALPNLKEVTFLGNPLDNSSKVSFSKNSASGKLIYIRWPQFEPNQTLLSDQRYSEWVNNPLKYGGLSTLQEIKNAEDYNIQELVLNDWQVSDLSPLRMLNNLTYLDLRNCAVSDLGPISNMNNLKTLVLSNNNLSDIWPIKELTNLQVLDLSNNNIAELSSLTSLGDLSVLKLANNNLEDEDLVYLGELSNLKSLNLKGHSFLNFSKTVLEFALPNTSIEW